MWSTCQLQQQQINEIQNFFFLQMQTLAHQQQSASILASLHRLHSLPEEGDFTEEEENVAPPPTPISTRDAFGQDGNFHLLAPKPKRPIDDAINKLEMMAVADLHLNK
jgi:hypothetical protein